MKAKFISALFIVLLQSSYSYAGQMIPRKSNGAWLYDAIFDVSTGKVVGNQPGLYAPNINNYNATATEGHKITHALVYGGSIEMYCRGSGGSAASTPCTDSNVFVYYDSGIKTTQVYVNAANPTGSYKVVTTIDGVVGADELLTFNDLSAADANVIADKAAKTLCADDRIDGVQFDLEPFNMTKVGQVNFFTRIAQNFAGQNKPGSPDPFGCVNANHPKGRFFSVFAFAGGANANVGKAFTKYNNGYFIDSLYDLDGTPAGTVTSPERFATLVKGEIAKMMSQAKTYNLKYQFGIPASASAHEFENVDGKNTGYKQIDYVIASINAINASGARADKLFRGINLWGFKEQTFVHGHRMLPNIPDTATLSYLGKNL